MKKIKKKKKKRIFLVILFLFYIGLMIVFGWKIMGSMIDNYQINQIIENVTEISPVQELDDSTSIEYVEQTEEKSIEDPYWDFIKVKLIDVNLNELKKENPDTIGWIQVNGSNINYPFVQSYDNDYYLNHSFNRKANKAGWVFLDYRNNANLTDKNNILYAHGRSNNTMFGSLRSILNEEWLNDTNNHVIRTSTNQSNALWQVFSVYKIPERSDYLKIKFASDNDFIQFSNLLLTRSVYNFHTEVNKNDKIITLSTCYNDTERVVLHAKLIKNSSR